MQIPSGEVKLNRGSTLEADATTTIELDFDGDRSIRATGNGVYMMNPVIAILSVTPPTPPAVGEPTIGRAGRERAAKSPLANIL